MDLWFVLSNLVSGISYGSIYGLFGMAIVLLYRTNHLFNFAQTEISTLMVIAMFFIMKKMAFLPALGLTLILSFTVGCFLHLGIMRVITERKNVIKSNQGVITIGLLYIFNSLSFYFFGDEPEPFPSLWPNKTISIFKVSIEYGQIIILICAVLIVMAITFFFKFTRFGLVLEATAENIEAARLRGVRASNYLAVSWGLTCLTSTLCGVMLAPTLFLSAPMLINVFSYALVAVIIGGLESPLGALVGGIMIGIVENFSSNWDVLGSDLKFVPVVVLLVLVLIVRPRGLWGRLEQRRV